MAKEKVVPKKVAPEKSFPWTFVVGILVAILAVLGAGQVRKVMREASDEQESKSISEKLDKEVTQANTDLVDAQSTFDTIIQAVDALGLDKARAQYNDDGKKASDAFARVKESFHHAQEFAVQMGEHNSADEWKDYFSKKADYYSTYEQLGAINLEMMGTLFDPSISDSKALVAKLRDSVEKRNGLLKRTQDQQRGLKPPEKQ